MRYFLTMLITLCAGALVAYVVAKILGHWWPRFATFAFFLICLWWLRLGWIYTKGRG
jgi:hypothetical protein